MKQIVTIMMVLFAITAFADRKDIINELSINIGIPTPSYTKAMDGLTSHDCVIQYRQSVDNPRTLNRLILFHLVLADNQLSSADIIVQKNGFAIAYEAANEVSSVLINNNLALGIVQFFLVPNIKLAPQETWQYMSSREVFMLYAFSSNNVKNMPALISAYRYIIDSSTSAKTANATRIRLIEALMANGQYNEALVVYNEITESSIKDGLSRIYPELLKKSK